MRYPGFSVKNELANWTPQLTIGDVSDDVQYGDLANLTNGNPAKSLKLSTTTMLLSFDRGFSGAPLPKIFSLIHLNCLGATVWLVGSNTSRLALADPVDGGDLSKGYGDWSRQALVSADGFGIGDDNAFAIDPYWILDEDDPDGDRYDGMTLLNGKNPDHRYFGFLIPVTQSNPIFIGQAWGSRYLVKFTHDFQFGSQLGDRRMADVQETDLGVQYVYPLGDSMHSVNATLNVDPDDGDIRAWWERTNGVATPHLLVPRPHQDDGGGSGFTRGAWFGRWALAAFDLTEVQNDGISTSQLMWRQISRGLPWGQV